MKKKMRIEKDSLGKIKVPYDALWGAQTQRSLQNFSIGDEKFPFEFIQAYALLKKAVSEANSSLKLISPQKAKIIGKVCDEILAGKHEKEFPLSVWQTGSGTQTNMNLNEVISNRCNQLSKKDKFHPNDDINLSQSTNDSFPTAMNLACILSVQKNLLPHLKKLISNLKKKETEFKNVIKMGRTHLMDATPLSASQEISAWRVLLTKSMDKILNSLDLAYELPIGGTAVGTGLNTRKNYDALVCKKLSSYTKLPFKKGENKFELLSAHSSLLSLSSSLKDLSVYLMKMAGDMRLLSSGPRSGLSEYILPANEPGSSIMPGKVNPTQIEALIMLCMQVISKDYAFSFADSLSTLQLNVSRPLIIYNLLNSIKLLSTGMTSFNDKCLKALKINKKKMKEYVENSLMLITAVSPHIGYDKASKIVQKAYKEGTSLKKQAIKLGYMTEKDYNKWIKPSKMIKPNL